MICIREIRTLCKMLLREIDALSNDFRAVQSILGAVGVVAAWYPVDKDAPLWIASGLTSPAPNVVQPRYGNPPDFIEAELIGSLDLNEENSVFRPSPSMSRLDHGALQHEQPDGDYFVTSGMHHGRVEIDGFSSWCIRACWRVNHETGYRLLHPLIERGIGVLLSIATLFKNDPYWQKAASVYGFRGESFSDGTPWLSMLTFLSETGKLPSCNRHVFFCGRADMTAYWEAGCGWMPVGFGLWPMTWNSRDCLSDNWENGRPWFTMTILDSLQASIEALQYLRSCILGGPSVAMSTELSVGPDISAVGAAYFSEEELSVVREIYNEKGILDDRAVQQELKRRRPNNRGLRSEKLTAIKRKLALEGFVFP
jgi:hypothetical protein